MHAELEKRFEGKKDVVFFHVQTVFEGFAANTPERGPREARGKGVKAPVGYDARVDGSRTSEMMVLYGTGGTPWTILIDKRRKVRMSQVTPGDVDSLEKTIEKMRRGR